MIGRKLLAMQYLKGIHLQSVSQHLVHGGFAHTGCGGQGSVASTTVSSQLFPRVFEEFMGADTPFYSAPWLVKGVSGLLDVFHNLPRH